jgi:hypothetical protein
VVVPLRVDILALETRSSDGIFVEDLKFTVRVPVCTSLDNPHEAVAELWADDSRLHSILMNKFLAPHNNRWVYAIADYSSRTAPGSTFEHAINKTVNSIVISGEVPLA